MITYKAVIDLQTVSHGSVNALATWTRREKIKEADGKKIESARRFFRIGTTSVRIRFHRSFVLFYFILLYIIKRESNNIIRIFE